MKVKVLSLDGNESGSIELPSQFSEEIREDLIKRAILAIKSYKRQKYGAKEEAGKRASAKLSRRRKYRGAYGMGISRVPRKILSRRGMRMTWVAAFAPGTVGGRRAHPPKSAKNWELKINKKERKKAIRSALAATASKDYIKFDKAPFVFEDKVESLNKTKEVRAVLNKIGLSEELERTANRKVRAGRGKSRGRKYRKKKGPLIIVSKDCPLIKSAKNIQGLDISIIRNLNAELLAPGMKLGRTTVYSQSAIEILRKEDLFN